MAAVLGPTPGEGNGTDAFFERCGLHPDTRFDCLAAVGRLFPFAHFEETSPQGYCSYTLCDKGLDKVVQFRPLAHRVDLRVAKAAREVYGDWAPEIEALQTWEAPKPRFRRASTSKEAKPWTGSTDEGVAFDDDHGSTGTFQVLSMTKISGMSLTELRAAQTGTDGPAWQIVQRQRESLIAQYASFVASGWKHRLPASDGRVGSLRGRVGNSMRWRLEQLRDHLPRRFRDQVQRTLDDFAAIQALPWVLTHGDIVPANVVVQKSDQDSDDWSIVGFLDWAEAEYLPFGVGLHGLEELLGETERADQGAQQFRYYPEASTLRNLFWSRLTIELERNTKGICALGQSHKIVEAAHVLGFLLWHGIAFDDGRLNRVVDENRDPEEIQRLDAFFASTGKALHDSFWRTGQQQQQNCEGG